MKQIHAKFILPTAVALLTVTAAFAFLPKAEQPQTKQASVDNSIGWYSYQLAQPVPAIPEAYVASLLLPEVQVMEAEADLSDFLIPSLDVVELPVKPSVKPAPPAALQLSMQQGPKGKTAAQCLALNLYHEARGEGVNGMAAVATVTLNRVENPRWPSDVCQVVYQPWQFSWTMDKASDTPKDLILYDQAYAIAQSALGVQNRYSKTMIRSQHKLAGADHYYAPSIVKKPNWAKKYAQITKIGVHHFYRS